MIGIRDYPLYFNDTVLDTMKWYRGENPDCTAREAWTFAQRFHRAGNHRAAERKKWSETYGHLIPSYENEP